MLCPSGAVSQPHSSECPMAPIAKENETVTTSGNPSNASNSPGKAAADTVRSQPVALEIPVTVNGARTIEGSDKREPFSESTQTVLVFTNGAVIRLASSLASGQLVFLTNEKTKKEVVCQVVKSKNYRTVTGYVELEFTEPAPGFWGMRFPAVAGTAPVAAAPVSPRPIPTVAPPISAIPAAPKITPPPAALSNKTVPPEVVAPVLPVPTVTASVTPPSTSTVLSAATESPSVLPAKPVSPIAAPDPSSLWGDVSPAKDSKPSTPSPIPYTVKPDGAVTKSKDYSNEIAAIFSVPQAPAEPKLVAQPPASPKLPVAAQPTAPNLPVSSEPLPPAKSSSPSTDELKQQAARLQEQLSAMLFSEPAAKPISPITTAAPKVEPAPSENVAQKVLQLTQADLAPTPAPPALAPVKISAPAAVKPPVKSTLDSEEVQIPAWLAPLARNTDATIVEMPVKSESRAVAEPEASPARISQELPATTETDATATQPTMFGGQLLSDSAAASEQAYASGSKKGLFIGIAAAAILVVAGAAWYTKRPGNMLTDSSSGKQAISRNANSESVPTLGASNSELGSLNSKAAPPASVTAAVAQPSASLTAPTTSSAPTARNTVPTHPLSTTTDADSVPTSVPETKKSSLGQVRLSTPVINHSAKTADSSGGEPALLDSQVAPNTDSMPSLAAGHNGPAAPAPIGGDVKQAKLIKSVPPLYPALARTQRISGNVQIDALIDEHGNVSSMKVLSGSPILHQSALTAVKQWKYEPAMLDGKPTPMHLTVTVQFRVQ